jgi:hypothetical protein
MNDQISAVNQHPLHAPSKWVVATLALARALALAAAASALPWQSGSLFTYETGMLAAADFVLCAAALGFAAERWLIVWRYNAWLTLIILAHLTWQVASAGVYLSGLYGSLGQGVAIASLAALSAGILLLLPMAWWGLARAGLGLPKGVIKTFNRRGQAIAALILSGALYLAGQSVHAEAAGHELLSAASIPDVLAPTQSGPRERAGALHELSPASCASHPDQWSLENNVVVLVGKRDALGNAVVVCWQLDSGDWQAELVRRLADVENDGIFALDVVTHVQRLDQPSWWGKSPEAQKLLAPFALRAGLDGWCADGHCFAPWQLVARSAFNQFRPIAAIHDLHVGIDLQALDEWTRARVPSTSERAHFRIATQSYGLTIDRTLQRLHRLREAPQAQSPATWFSAAKRAQDYITRAQNPDGSFVYLYQPLSGIEDRVSVSLARHAGTTLALCEMGANDRQTRKVIDKALNWLAERTATYGAWKVIERAPLAANAGLGEIALPLIALARCRERTSNRHDALIVELASTLLWMQRSDGSFTPRVGRDGEKIEGASPLYAEGQSVLALLEVMATDLLDESQRQIAKSALQRTMDYVANEYWQHDLAPFFFMEENWHCLAARRALSLFRHDGYEAFCLDYLAFKSRLIFDEKSEVALDSMGAYGFGNLVVPHVTPAAGFVEAAAAGVEIARKRGLDTKQAEDQIAKVVNFVAASQWTEQTCGGCVEPQRAIGGFSESKINPVIRIDFVQHAWSALHYGQKVTQAS